MYVEGLSMLPLSYFYRVSNVYQEFGCKPIVIYSLGNLAHPCSCMNVYWGHKVRNVAWTFYPNRLWAGLISNRCQISEIRSITVKRQWLAYVLPKLVQFGSSRSCSELACVSNEMPTKKNQLGKSGKSSKTHRSTGLLCWNMTGWCTVRPWRPRYCGKSTSCQIQDGVRKRKNSCMK